MNRFVQAIQTQCAIFAPYQHQKIEIASSLFSRSQATVAEFIAEIEQTCLSLTQQSHSDYADFYAQRLVQQFDLLKRAVDRLSLPQQKLPKFNSSYRFAKNLKNLPKKKQRAEFYKALRALNDKIAWLTEQCYRYADPQTQATLQAQIQETEYRKQKCLAAIDALSE